MRTFLVYVLAFIVAVAVAGVTGSVVSTQFVIAALNSIDVAVPFGVRISMTVRDFGILPTLLPAVAACFLPGFLVAGLCASKIGGSRIGWFTVAGATALVAELMLMRAALGLMPIAGARSTFGMLSFALAGAAGGWVFARLTTRRTSPEIADA